MLQFPLSSACQHGDSTEKLREPGSQRGNEYHRVQMGAASLDIHHKMQQVTYGWDHLQGISQTVLAFLKPRTPYAWTFYWASSFWNGWNLGQFAGTKWSQGKGWTIGQRFNGKLGCPPRCTQATLSYSMCGSFFFEADRVISVLISLYSPKNWGVYQRTSHRQQDEKATQVRGFLLQVIGSARFIDVHGSYYILLRSPWAKWISISCWLLCKQQRYWP